MKTLLLSLLFTCISFTAFAEQTYTCTGQNVSGIVKVNLNRRPTDAAPFPSYSARSHLNIAGRAVNLSCSGNLSYFQREIPFGRGAWEYDKSIWIFALRGANLGYSSLGEGFHLEVSQSSVRGYLGHRDHLQGPENLAAYDFSCQ